MAHPASRGLRIEALDNCMAQQLHKPRLPIRRFDNTRRSRIGKIKWKAGGAQQASHFVGQQRAKNDRPPRIRQHSRKLCVRRAGRALIDKDHSKIAD